MLAFYSVIVLEACFLMGILAIMANTNDRLPQHRRRLFLLLFLGVTLAVIAEWAGTATTVCRLSAASSGAPMGDVENAAGWAEMNFA